MYFIKFKSIIFNWLNKTFLPKSLCKVTVFISKTKIFFDFGRKIMSAGAKIQLFSVNLQKQ